MTTTGYQHSRVFASLKNITEGLTENLTTSQYLQAYDEYIENAISPIIVGTRLFDSFLARLVGWQEKNFRRKVSFKDRHFVPGLAISFLLQPTPAGRIDAYRKLQLDRGIRLEFIKLFFSKLELYIKACDCRLRYKNSQGPDLGYCMKVKTSIEAELHANLPLLSIYEESKFWYQHAVAFKQLILEKYVRMCLNEAQKDYVSYFGHKIDLDDIIQIYLLAASRAIDKCDSKQGALTSHIKNWLLTGRSRAAEQLERQGCSLPVDNLDFESEEFRSTVISNNLEAQEDAEEHLNTIRCLAKLADPLGVVRAYLGIEEVLSEAEVCRLKQGANNESRPEYSRTK